MVSSLPFRAGRWEGKKGVYPVMLIEGFDDGDRLFSSPFPYSYTTNPTMSWHLA